MSSPLLIEVRSGSRVPAPGVAKAIRLAAGVSQTRLAAELGVHRVTLARWETGVRTPTGRDRARWGDLLFDLIGASK